MITINALGRMGRLANQMFQYAALRTLAKKFNYSYHLPLRDPSQKLIDEDLDIFECFKLNGEERKNSDLYQIEMSTLGFDENIFNKCPDNVDLKGYFQDVKYFENNREDIKQSFTFKDQYSEQAKNYFYSAFGNEEILSLHVRRSDYLNFDHFVKQNAQYYSDALRFFDPNLKVLIFTDDYEWAINQEIFQSERFFFSTGNNNAVDLYMQTLCKYHIIANSTYSWWGAWLADSKRVVKPTNWFDGILKDYKNFLHVDGWINV